MNRPVFSALLVGSFGLVTLGCASPVEIKANLDPNDYATCPSGGTVRLNGSTFVRKKNGIVVTGAGRHVHLDPATLYSAAVFRALAEKQKDDQAFHLEKESETVVLNTVMLKCRRSVQADADGKFAFANVSPGPYILSSYISWMKPRGEWEGAWSIRTLMVSGEKPSVGYVLSGSPPTVQDPPAKPVGSVSQKSP